MTWESFRKTISAPLALPHPFTGLEFAFTEMQNGLPRDLVKMGHHPWTPHKFSKNPREDKKIVEKSRENEKGRGVVRGKWLTLAFK